MITPGSRTACMKPIGFEIAADETNGSSVSV